MAEHEFCTVAKRRTLLCRWRHETVGKKPVTLNRKCREARESYASGIQIVDDFAIYYFVKPAFFDGHPKKEILLACLDHIRGCADCQCWLQQQVPPEILERQKRAAKYCCFTMFAAVEETGSNRITFELFRGEDPCWKIDGKRSFISFCPWCGERLPGKPFIPEIEET